MRSSILPALVLAIAVEMLTMATAQAQATRTWVSGLGDDVNPCSRTAPCKTFAGAISKTAAGGEINCIEPGGFGTVTITKSITIDCGGTFGSILASGVNGVIVNGANITVTLRNLSIDGGGTVLGLNGIRFIQSGTLRVENVQIFNFSTVGIDFTPTSFSELFVTKSEIYNVGTGTAVGGINIRPAAGVAILASVLGTTLQNNSAGIVADTSVANAVSSLTIRESTIGTNTGAGLLAKGGTQKLNTTVHLSSVHANGGTGVASDGVNSTVQLGLSMVTANATGLSLLNGGKIVSFSSNILSGNIGADGAPSSTVPSQ